MGRKKAYETPVMELVLAGAVDVISTSPFKEPGPNDESGWGPIT